MLYDRPTIEFFVVLGRSPNRPSNLFGPEIYGEAKTNEGAELLREEAERTGWTLVYVHSRRKSAY